MPGDITQSRQHYPSSGHGTLGWAPEPVSKLGSDPITLLAAKQASQRRQQQPGSVPPQSPLASRHPVHSTFSHGPSSPRLSASPSRRRGLGSDTGSNVSSLPNIGPDAFAPLHTSRTACLSLGDMRQELKTVLSVPRRQASTVFSHAARTAALRGHPGPHRGEPKVLIRGRPVDPVVAEGIKARAQAVVDVQTQGGAMGAHIMQQERQQVSEVQNAVRDDLRLQKRHEGLQERARSSSPAQGPHHLVPRTPLQSPSKGLRGSPKLHHSGTFYPHPDKVAPAPARLATSFPPPESAFAASAHLAPTATHIPPIPAAHSRPQTVTSPTPQSHHGLRTAGREAATTTLDEQESFGQAPSRTEPSLSAPGPAAAPVAHLGVTCSPPPVYTYPIKMTISELGLPLGRIARDLHRLSQYDPVPEPLPPPTTPSHMSGASGKPVVAVAAGESGGPPLRSPAGKSPVRPQTEPVAATDGSEHPPIQRTPSKSILRPSKPSLHDVNMQGDYRWRAQAMTAKTTANLASVKRIKSAKSVRFLVVEGHHTDLGV